MKHEADAQLVTIYVNSTDQYRGQALYSAIVQLCKQCGIAGATVMRCVEGYGGHRHIHTTRLLELSENLPVRIEIIDVAQRIQPLLAALEPMISEGVMTVADVRLTRFGPAPPPG